MKYFLSDDCVLKLLEKPCVYRINKDELFELDEEAFESLSRCAAGDGFDVAPDSKFVKYCIDEGILKKGKGGNSPPSAKRAAEPFSRGYGPQGKRYTRKKPSLRYLELQITQRCNLRCRHCYTGPPSDHELTVKDIEQILTEFQTMQGLRLLITGGEPLMHREFNRINSILPEYALRKILFTNGILLAESLLRRLNVDEIQVSVDGLEEAHDSLRGKGTFKKVMQCIENALYKDFEVSVSTMIHPGNLGDLDDMQDIFKSIGIKDWIVDAPCLDGNLKKNPSFHLPPQTAGRYLGYGFGEGLHGETGGATAPREKFACGPHLMAVMADGNCAKCTFYSDEPLGHFKKGLTNCWQRLRHTNLKELECDCDMLQTCRGGCRHRASLLGSPFGKDLYKCVFYGKL